MEEKIIEVKDWTEEYRGERTPTDSKFFSDKVAEGQLAYITKIKFKTSGEKATNSFGKEVVKFIIEHEGKEKVLEIGVNQYDLLSTIAKKENLVGSTADWQRSGTNQKDTRRAIKF